MDEAMARAAGAPGLAERLAAHVAQRCRGLGASEAEARWAQTVTAALCRAQDDGHVCLPWRVWAGSVALEDARERLLRSGAAAAVDAMAEAVVSAPLVLDEDGRLYLNRLHHWEQRLRAALQRVGGRLSLVTGGPGTGKTTTLCQRLVAHLEQHPTHRVLMAAPTGKAAARMAQAVAAQAQRLAAPVPAGLPTQACTVHRLLGVGRAGAWFHRSNGPLPAEVVVVDEASMLDLPLATLLLEGLAPEATMVWLGDRDQLPPVGVGAVLAALTHPDWPGPQGRTTLTHSHRFDSGSAIGRLAAAVREGRCADALTAMAATKGSEADGVDWLDLSGAGAMDGAMARVEAGFAAYLAAEVAGAPHEARLAALDGFRVLCAAHEGPWGVAAFNRRWAERWRAQVGGPSHRLGWAPGTPLMVTRNDPDLDLSNGDVGVVAPGDSPGSPWLWWTGGAGQPLRSVPVHRLPQPEVAWAMTIHKSQGSEFNRVLAVLPPNPSRPWARSAWYTAITRAKHGLTLASTPEALVTGLAQARLTFHGLHPGGAVGAPFEG